MSTPFAEKKETLLQFFDKALDKVFADELERDYSQFPEKLRDCLADLGFVGGVGDVLAKAIEEFLVAEELLPAKKEEVVEDKPEVTASV